MARKTLVMFYSVVLVVIGLNSKVIAQDSVFRILMRTSTFECKFTAGKTADITEIGKPLKFNQDGTTIVSKGEWILHEKVDKGFSSITFRQIRRGEGLSVSAQMSGNTGNINQVEGFLGPGFMTLVESMGGASMTTIFAELDRNKEMIAVHSRHTKTFPSKVIASQYYGSCRPIAQ